MVLGNAVRCAAVLMQAQVQVQVLMLVLVLVLVLVSLPSLPPSLPPSLSPCLHLLTCVRVPFPRLSSPPQVKPANKGAATKNSDAKWHAVTQLAVTALDEAVEHTDEGSTLWNALLSALKRARLPACVREAPRRHHERPLSCDQPSERQHVELRRHQAADALITHAGEEARTISHGRRHDLLIEPLRQALCVRGHGTRVRTSPWPSNPPTTSLALDGAARMS
jgi:hypothetical protein